MKTPLLFLAVASLAPIAPVPSQSLADYVAAVKGDTLVVKDYYEMNRQPNSLSWVLLLDTVDVPATRVYELKTNGFYPHYLTPQTIPNHPAVIVGSDPTIMVNNKDANASPPVICNAIAEVDPGIIGFEARGDLTMKNCALVPAGLDGGVDWLFASVPGSDLHLVFDNCIMERTKWVFVALLQAHCSLTFRNCYFVNMNGYPCRRYGGVFDCFAAQDSLLVENCTHVMAQGSMYGLRTYPFGSVRINRNTFINCSGYTFLNLGFQNNISITNNIFVNCNLHPLDGCRLSETGEGDVDMQPIGLVNVYPEGADTVDPGRRRFLVQNNLVYWDPSLARCDSILNANRINGSTCWESQAVIMNSRTREMFDDDAQYPYLVTDTWKTSLPHFIDPKDLCTTQAANIKTFVIAAAEDTTYATLPDWSLLSTGQESFVHPDWPIPVDLSYSDPDLLTAGTGGFPIGDLNWFPARKAAWLAQRAAEYEEIDAAVHTGRLLTAVLDPGGPATDFQLQQNFPNPFNPNTTISFSLAKPGFVTLKVYDLLGREVVTLFEGFKEPQTYSLKFDGTSLSSGVYFCRLTASGVSQTRKILLAK